MNEKTRLIAAIIVFGSLWGFLEAILGSALKTVDLPYGAIMTAGFAVPLLLVARRMYAKPGVSSGIGLVAGSMAFFNPWVGCSLCSAIAIAAEGLIFEILWLKIDTQDTPQYSLIQKASLGVISAYAIYIGGYTITQILTPVLFGNFYLENLAYLLPQILARGLPAALLGGITVTAALSIKPLDSSLPDRLYYPLASGVSAICWIIVIGSWFLLAV